VSPIRRPRKTQVLVLLALTVAAVGAALILRPQSADDSAAAGSPNSAQTAVPTDGADSAAATSSAPYTIKAEPTFVATDEQPSTSGDRVDVVLTYAAFDAASGAVQANGFAAGVIENGGTCTLTLTRDGKEVTATSTAEADASTTSCGLLETTDGLASGTWDAVLTYSSDDAHGKSGAMEVTVP
jgi:hypothetical protein